MRSLHQLQPVAAPLLSNPSPGLHSSTGNVQPASRGGKGERAPTPRWGAPRVSRSPFLFASPPASPYCSGRKLRGSFGAGRLRPGSPPRKRRSASGLRLRPSRSERQPPVLTKRARRRAAATAKRAKSRGCPSRRAKQKQASERAGNPQRRPRAKSRENPTPSVAGKRAPAEPGRLGLEASLFLDLDLGFINCPSCCESLRSSKR